MSSQANSGGMAGWFSYMVLTVMGDEGDDGARSKTDEMVTNTRGPSS